nr:hypothetical protein [Oceanisphaera profunda]
MDAEYEGNRQFFYPTPETCLIPAFVKKGEAPRDIDAKLANVELANIPFLALRDLVPGKYLEANSVDFGRLVADVQKYRQADDYVIIINIPERTVSLLDQTVDFSKDTLSLAYLLMMALAKKNKNLGEIKNNDYFIKPNEDAPRKEYELHTHEAAISFINSYLLIDKQLPKNNPHAINNQNFINLRDQVLSLIASDEKDEKLKQEQPKDRIDEYFNKQLNLEEVVGKKYQFLEALLKNNGMTSKYMDTRRNALKNRMSLEFGEHILKEIMPNGSLNAKGNEENTKKQGLPLDADRIEIIFPQ